MSGLDRFGLVMLVLMVTVAVLLAFSMLQPLTARYVMAREFDSRLWREARVGSLTRTRMVEQLLGEGLLSGRTREEVLHTLGAPGNRRVRPCPDGTMLMCNDYVRRRDDGAETFVYDLGPAMVEESYLFVDFDPTDVVVSIEVGTH